MVFDRGDTQTGPLLLDPGLPLLELLPERVYRVAIRPSNLLGHVRIYTNHRNRRNRFLWIVSIDRLPMGTTHLCNLYRHQVGNR